MAKTRKAIKYLEVCDQEHYKYYLGKNRPASSLAGFVAGVFVTLFIMGTVLYYLNQFVDVI